MKVAFIEAKANKDIAEDLAKVASNIDYKKIGLISTVQFVKQLSTVKKILEKKGFFVFIGKPTGSAILEGQVLGCDVSSALSIEKEIDCFLFVGTGDFHPLGLLAKTNKPLLTFNPFTSQLKLLSNEERQKILKKRVLMLAKFKDAKTVGILVSTKPGQCQLQASTAEIKEKLEKQGKKVYLFVCDSITNAELRNFAHVGAWVNTACPRLIEDEFDKPFVNALELSDSLLNAS